MNKLDKIIEDVKKLSNEFKSKSGNKKIKLSNKDFNLWIVNKLMEQDGRISKLEGKQSLLCKVTIGIIPIFILIVKVI